MYVPRRKTCLQTYCNSPWKQKIIQFIHGMEHLHFLIPTTILVSGKFSQNKGLSFISDNVCSYSLPAMNIRLVSIKAQSQLPGHSGGKFYLVLMSVWNDGICDMWHHIHLQTDSLRYYLSYIITMLYTNSGWSQEGIKM